ncbi:MAG: IclR family transcriptional regulator [Deltaproteobacteria bacterium]|nr:IclR family transcriptional regulator [Deltaproteobacteria bacterium]
MRSPSRAAPPAKVPAEAPPHQYRAPAVARAFAVLRLLAEVRGPLGISEIARSLGASKGSIHGILLALREEGAVEEMPGKKFHLGPLVGKLAQSRSNEVDLPEIAEAFLRNLSRETGQTAVLGIPDRSRLRIEAVIEGAQDFRVGAAPGMTVPLLAGATGKVLIAWGGVPVPADLPQATLGSVATREELERELEEVRKLGVAFDRGEYLQGVAAVASPVRDASGKLAGVLYALGFVDRLPEPQLQELGRKVRQAALSLSQSLR